MTMSMVCFFCLSSTGGFASSTISPSTTARVKPSFTICIICLRYSPFLPRMYGARIVNFVPGASAISLSTICWMVCGRISWPQFVQCGTPIDAYSRRR